VTTWPFEKTDAQRIARKKGRKVYAKDVKAKIRKERAQAVHDWVFHTVPGTSVLAVIFIASTFLAHSTAYTVMVTGTAMFLVGMAVGRDRR
jgi:hypothetical protein